MTLDSDGQVLTACVHEAVGEVRGALAMAAPHPAHGGHMDHPVVAAAAERAALAGIRTLRFDFRGVRQSEGDVHDGDGHARDAVVALDAATELAAGGILLAGGFSYGARMMVRVISSGAAPAVRGLLLLAPATRIPQSRRDFANLLLGRTLSDAARDPQVVAALGSIQVRTRVLVGEHDVVAPPDELHDALPPTAALDVLPESNHFFSRERGAGRTAYDLLHPALDRALGALAYLMSRP